MPNFTFIGAEMWEYSRQNCQNFEFGHKFAPQRSLVCTFFTKFSVFVITGYCVYLHVRSLYHFRDTARTLVENLELFLSQRYLTLPYWELRHLEISPRYFGTKNNHRRMELPGSEKFDRVQPLLYMAWRADRVTNMQKMYRIAVMR